MIMEYQYKESLNDTGCIRIPTATKTMNTNLSHYIFRSSNDYAKLYERTDVKEF